MEAYIYDAVRTPRGRGKADGSLHEITPIQLATQVLEAVRDRNQIDTADVDDVILGCVSPVGEQGADIARVAVLNADYAQTVPGVQINRFCASGLEAVNMAAAKVFSGEAMFAIGGGVESMSRVPMASGGGALAMDPAVAYKTYFAPQGIGADVIATKFGISRDDADAYAVESQKRAKQAWDEGRFKKSILPVKDVIGQVVLDHDEHMRPDATMQSLGSLKPSFAALGEEMPGFDTVALLRYPELEKVNHVHHAGNSSGIVDGAAAVLVGNKDMGEKYGLKPRARIKAMASIGSEPLIMLTGPEFVAGKLLARAGMTKDDIDLYEINEAFAVVAAKFVRDLDLDWDKVNGNGGPIALGHPIGATGSILIGTMVDELERQNKRYGLVTMCAAGGMAPAIIVERVDDFVD